MPGNSPLYYWDACIFLAWLKDEERRLGEMDGVREVIDRTKRREAKIMTSVLTSVEVLSSKIPDWTASQMSSAYATNSNRAITGSAKCASHQTQPLSLRS